MQDDIQWPRYLRPMDQAIGGGSRGGGPTQGMIQGPAVEMGGVSVTPSVQHVGIPRSPYNPSMYRTVPALALSTEMPLFGGTLRVGGEAQHAMTNIPGLRNRTDVSGGAEYTRPFETPDAVNQVIDALMARGK